jgi:hypothetical protein
LNPLCLSSKYLFFPVRIPSFSIFCIFRPKFGSPKKQFCPLVQLLSCLVGKSSCIFSEFSFVLILHFPKCSCYFLFKILCIF